MRLMLITVSVFFSPAILRADDPDRDVDAYDIEILQEQGVKQDAGSLLAFFRERTLDETKINRLGDLIKQLGDSRFKVRDRTMKELLAIGVPALKYLEMAQKDADSEIARRAQQLVERIGAGPGSSLPIAAARQLRRFSSDDIARVLLAYLPDADDTNVVDEVMTTLIVVGVRSGKIDMIFCDNARNSSAARRAAAALVLGRSRDRHDVDLAIKLLDDSVPSVRLRAAEGLLAGNHKEAGPGLIRLLHPSTDESTWRAEDLLRQIAGEASPEFALDEKPDTRIAYQKKWFTWWETNEKKIDLSKLAQAPPVLGLWLGVEYNTNTVWECGRDGKRRWTIKAEGPMDAQILPGNRVLIAEQTAKRVTERDLKGNTLWECTVDEEVLNCQRLRNGNTFIGTRFSAIEVRPNKSVVLKHRVSDVSLHAIRRVANGNFVGLTSAGVIHEISAGGKSIRTIAMPAEGTWGDVDSLPGGRYLVSNYGSGFVREIAADGKLLREIKVGDACGVDRLPNDQLLISGQNKAASINWEGKSNWNMSSDGCIRRIHQR